MNNLRWHRMKELFGSALDVPKERRDAWLEERCAGSPSILAEVRSLLRHREQMVGFLNRPAFSEEAVTQAASAIAGSAESTLREDSAPVTLTPGDTLVDRYVVGKRIGVGAFGAVHRAEDRLAGRDVAIKVVSAGIITDPVRLRREVAILRRTRLPGVVQLLDDWSTADSTFIVMELVDGSAFPGPAGGDDWDAIAPRAVALLEALERLHWAGVVHRDIKPSNVLVDGDQRVTIVDFGVAWETDSAASRAPAEYIVGTPHYMAPERLRGRQATRRSDIYSVGAMLWEVLAGEPLHAGETIHELAAHRCHEAPRPLRSVAPHVPEAVAAVIDRMVEQSPQARPSSAARIAALLSGRLSSGEIAPLPRIGSPRVVDDIVAAGRKGTSLDVWGERGMGKTRALRDASERLAAEGFRVAGASPSSEPYASLAPVTGPVPADPGWTLADARAWIDRRLASALGAGLIVVADDLESLDPWSVEALEAVRDQGCVLRARRGASGDGVLLEPLSREELRALFAGSDRLHHLREDAAALLHERTAGVPAAMADEMRRWVRDGVARFEGDRAVVARTSLDRYLAQPHLELPPLDVDTESLPEAARDLMALIEIASRRLTLDELARIAGVPPWRAEVVLETLAELGVIRRGEGGSIEPIARVGAAALWDGARRRTAHAAVAAELPLGTEERLFHLIAADEVGRAPSEACDVAQRLFSSGHAARAFATLEEALALLRRGGAPDTDTEEAALTLLVDCALALGTTSALDLTLYHLARVRSPSRRARSYEKVCRAALLAVRGDGRRALALLADERDDGNVSLGRARHNVRALAARFSAPEVERDVLASAARWVRRHPSRSNRALLAAWVGWMRYREEQFLSAARRHRRAARLERNPRARLTASLDAASAALEAGALDEAREAAQRAHGLAADARHVLQEARAERALRAVAYRADRADAPDLELLDAVDRIGMPNLEGMIYLNEAAVAWRRGRAALAHGLADAAAQRFATAGLRWGRLLARALSAACRHSISDDEARELLSEARECPLPGITVQTLGLLADACAELPQGTNELARRVAGGMSEAARDRRREVLSAREALGRMG